MTHMKREFWIFATSASNLVQITVSSVEELLNVAVEILNLNPRYVQGVVQDAWRDGGSRAEVDDKTWIIDFIMICDNHDYLSRYFNDTFIDAMEQCQ